MRAAAFQAPLINPTRFPVVPGTLYQFNQRQFTARQTADTTLPVQTLWGFDDGTGARSPGPTYQAFYGRPQLTRNINSLPPGNASEQLRLRHAVGDHPPAQRAQPVGERWQPVRLLFRGPLLRPVLPQRAGRIQLRPRAQRRHQRVAGHAVVSRSPGRLHFAEHLQGPDGVLLSVQPVRYRRQQHRLPPARLPAVRHSAAFSPTRSTIRPPASWSSTCSTSTASSATSSW